MFGGNIQLSNNFESNGIDQKITYGLEFNHNDASRIRKSFENNSLTGIIKLIQILIF